VARQGPPPSAASHHPRARVDQLLRRWSELRQRLRRGELSDEDVEELVELIDVRARMVAGSAGRGALPSHSVRPCLDPEELEYVDVEETIEGLISKCKRLEEVTYEDLMVRAPERGRIAVALLLDASGSMGGGKLATMSVAAAVLLRALRECDVALAVFESDVYRVKEVGEDVDMREVVRALLGLEPMGGTCASRALLWAEEQLHEVGSGARALILLSDLALYDASEAEFVVGRMVRDGVAALAVVPRRSYDVATAHRLELAGLSVLEASGWREAASLALEQLGGRC